MSQSSSDRKTLDEATLASIDGSPDAVPVAWGDDHLGLVDRGGAEITLRSVVGDGNQLASVTGPTAIVSLFAVGDAAGVLAAVQYCSKVPEPSDDQYSYCDVPSQYEIIRFNGDGEAPKQIGVSAMGDLVGMSVAADTVALTVGGTVHLYDRTSLTEVGVLKNPGVGGCLLGDFYLARPLSSVAATETTVVVPGSSALDAGAVQVTDRTGTMTELATDLLPSNISCGPDGAVIQAASTGETELLAVPAPESGEDVKSLAPRVATVPTKLPGGSVMRSASVSTRQLELLLSSSNRGPVGWFASPRLEKPLAIDRSVVEKLGSDAQREQAVGASYFLTSNDEGHHVVAVMATGSGWRSVEVPS